MIEIKRSAAGPTTLAYGISFGPHILLVMSAMGAVAGYYLWKSGYTVLRCAAGGALTVIVFHLVLSGVVFCVFR